MMAATDSEFQVELFLQADYRFEVHFAKPGIPVLITDEEAPTPVNRDIPAEAAALIAQNPHITKAELAKRLKVSRSHFENPPGWLYLQKDKRRPGKWVPVEPQLEPQG